jgi:hypothetical protein
VDAPIGWRAPKLIGEQLNLWVSLSQKLREGTLSPLLASSIICRQIAPPAQPVVTYEAARECGTVLAKQTGTISVSHGCGPIRRTCDSKQIHGLWPKPPELTVAKCHLCVRSICLINRNGIRVHSASQVVHQKKPNSSLASSVIISGDQGGLSVTSTLTSPAPSSAFSVSRTSATNCGP